MELSGQFHVPAALSPEKEAVWASQSVCMWWEGEKNPCPCQELNPIYPAYSLELLHTKY